MAFTAVAQLDKIAPSPASASATVSAKTASSWAKVQAPLDRQLAPLGRRGIASLVPRVGERTQDDKRTSPVLRGSVVPKFGRLKDGRLTEA